MGSKVEQISDTVFKVTATVDRPEVSFSLKTGIGFDVTSPVGTSSVRLVAIDGVPVEDLNLNLSQQEGDWWIDVVPGVDFSIQKAKGRISTVKRIKTDKAPRSFTWTISKGANKFYQPIGADNELELPVENNFVRRALEITVEESGGTYTETWTGRVLNRERLTRLPEWTDDAIYPVTMDPTVGPTNDSEDCYDVFDGANTISFNNTSADMYTGQLTNAYDVGLYFAAVDVPQGATITSALLALTVQFNYGGPPMTLVCGQAADNPADWTGAASDDPQHMVRTTATVNKAWAVGLDTVDVTPIVQENVNSVGWNPNQSMKFGILATMSVGQTTLSTQEHSTDPDPTLTIVYSTGGVSSALAARRLGQVPYARSGSGLYVPSHRGRG